MLCVRCPLGTVCMVFLLVLCVRYPLGTVCKVSFKHCV